SRGARAGRRDGAATKSVATDASRRQGAATARRAQPTRRGPIPVSRARSIMVAPVVPHEIAASPTSSKPINMVSAVYESHDVGMRKPPTCRRLKRVQRRGGARELHARRSLSTLSVQPRAPTKQMGPFQPPAQEEW